jgi:hypothetical protein
MSGVRVTALATGAPPVVFAAGSAAPAISPVAGIVKAVPIATAAAVCLVRVAAVFPI